MAAPLEEVQDQGVTAGLCVVTYVVSLVMLDAWVECRVAVTL